MRTISTIKFIKSALEALDASVTSFLHLAVSFGIFDALSAAWAMMVGVSRAAVFKECRTTKVERAERTATCLKCPIYDTHFKTCGTPGMLSNSGLDTVGCWCPTALATFVKAKKCWLSTRGKGRWKS